MDKISELLKPRYKVIADYPGNELPVGTILSFDIESVYLTKEGEMVVTKTWTGIASSYFFSVKLKIGQYPHLFQKLEWWEERSPDEMPEYLKTANKALVEKITAYGYENKTVLLDTHVIGMPIHFFSPATIEEYNEYKK